MKFKQTDMDVFTTSPLLTPVGEAVANGMSAEAVPRPMIATDKEVFIFGQPGGLTPLPNVDHHSTSAS